MSEQEFISFVLYIRDLMNWRPIPWFLSLHQMGIVMFALGLASWVWNYLFDDRS